MAQYRQTGTERFAFRNPHEFHNNDNGGVSDQISIRVPHKHPRFRRQSKNRRKISVAAVALILALGLIVTFFFFQRLTSGHKGVPRSLNNWDGESKHEGHLRPTLNRSNATRQLGFGMGSTKHGGDSRYWDRDDRRRDDDYDRDILELTGVNTNDEHVLENENTENMQWASRDGSKDSDEKGKLKHGSGGLYNEVGRNELKQYEDKYKASLSNEDQSEEQGNQDEEVDFSDEYDDGIDLEDAHLEWPDEVDRLGRDHLDEGHDDGTSHSISQREAVTTAKSAVTDTLEKNSAISHKSAGNAKLEQGNAGGNLSKVTGSGKKSGSKRKPKQHKFSGSSCEIRFLDSIHELVEPVETKRFSRFSLQYTDVEDRPSGVETWEPRFAGHQSLREREESFYARNQRINCGFVKGPKGSPSTGFDLAEDDLRYMSSCHIAVSSCIFGSSDHLRTPHGKTITRSSRKNVCFVMFVDEATLQTLSSEGQKPDRIGFVGLWRIVVVKNLPFTDMRRVGKIPKFLTHRLFPSARYSIWLDSKLRLQSDPFLILEYFLWRKGYEYAISNHYDRHCVWEEVMQNKKLNKFNHTIIDQQFTFYQADGLKRFDPSDTNKLLPSYVPEGSFIIRAHTPMSNLFSCLWFNEVDRFTPRDQLSFAYTYLKLRRMNLGKPFRLNMFKDCERRSIAKLYRHRAEDKRNSQLQVM